MNRTEQTNKTYWKTPQGTAYTSSELFTILPNGSGETTRRDFLTMMGFTLATLGLGGCSRGPVQHAIPLVAASADIIPGVSNWYASTCAGCSAGCSLLVKTRDGRPIKVEGNADSTLFGGGTCALGQATVLSLYDDARLRGPSWRGESIDWKEIDQRILGGIQAAKAKQQKTVLLSRTLVSPSTREIVGQWRSSDPNFRHVVYDPISFSALREAQQKSFGSAVIPHYRFDQARMVVGIEADFLGTWLSPVEFARQYSVARNPVSGGPSCHHVQIESGFSITGANADVRISMPPSEMGSAVVALLHGVARKAGVGDFPSISLSSPEAKKLEVIADQLWQHRGRSLVVSGVQDVSLQVTIAALNAFLGNIGKTIDLARPSLQRTGDDQEMAALIEEMNRGEIGALILYNVNPAYDYADPDRFLQGLQKVPLSVSFADRRDETSSHADAICPDHYFLEAWGDAEPVESYFSLAQPTIAPIFQTRAAQESLLRWLSQDGDYYTYLREFWRKNMFSRQDRIQNFDQYWDTTLQAGVADFPPKEPPRIDAFHGDWKASVHNIQEAAKTTSNRKYEVHLFESIPVRDGSNANNPWLQELPDPITRLTWGNAAAIAPSLAKELGVQSGDIVSLKTDRGVLEAPVYVQPGQQAKTISIALGYGRKQAGKAGNNVGVNAYPLTSIVDGVRRYTASATEIKKTGAHEDLAATQTHFSIEGRPIIQEMTLEELRTAEKEEKPAPSLWPERPDVEHSWGMIIDLDKCTGCSACVIACQAENNVPVVGKSEIRRNREMHWIRIDRYYSGSEDNPTSVQQPMMCQHCGHAPCETVCPVLATSHSSDGLNQQVYNRCVGTRYCANNCPYKVRRFNWFQYSQNPEFDFTMENPLGRMVLNPDVTVRSRGVMEKCSMCIQRIQIAKAESLQHARPLADGDIQTACQQVCPTQAIVFGDFKDPHSRALQLRRGRRYYHVLEDLGTQPNVGYLAKIRNSPETEGNS